jgi:hypothetical protein
MKNAALSQAPTPRGRTVAADDEPANNSAYDEYLRGFDDIPVLQDAVRIPPPLPRQPEFRRGERRDVRREQRPDAYSLREATLTEIELLYCEYAQPTPVAQGPKRKKRQKSKTKSSNAGGKVASKRTARKKNSKSARHST